MSSVAGANRATIATPTGLLELVRYLSLLRLDPIAAVAPSADLVVWSRLGLPSWHAAERLGVDLVEIGGRPPSVPRPFR